MKSKNNALIENVTVRVVSSIISYIQSRRVEIGKQDIDDKVEIINVELEVESKNIFKMFERILPFVPNEYHEFFIDFFEVLDGVENIDIVSSVTPRNTRQWE